MEEGSALRRVDVEEDTRYDDDLSIEAGFEERETRVERSGEILEISPNIESSSGDVVDADAHLLESTDSKVSLFTEVDLESFGILIGPLGIEQGQSSVLKRMVGSSLQE